MDRLIKVINKLQDAFTILGEDPLSLPQIAVVGGQSAGKSSVLENIVGRDFLPRGSGIVTRRPLVLKLINEPELKVEYCEFLHLPNKKFSYEDARKEIENATENDPRCLNKSISDAPINLTVHSAQVLDLTLIDLPGLTRVAVGDQPKDINDQIRALILKYIQQENTIILAVSPANQDLANSDAIQLAKEVDPDGFRTVGVLTKLDLMDKGTNAMPILNNEVIPLKLGYIPVVNRSQHDIEQKMDIKTQWSAEDSYFSSHPAYRMIKERCGTEYLAKVLNKTLMQHIKNCLPDINNKIGAFTNVKKNELIELKELKDDAAKSQAVLGCIVGYAQKFKDKMEGNDDDATIDQLTGGAKLRSLFKGQFLKNIENVDVLSSLAPAQIRNIINNSGGLKGGLFIPDEAFQVVIRQGIKQLKAPSIICLQNVYDELLNQAMSIETESMGRYNVLRETIRRQTRNIISSRKEQTEALVNTLIDMEAALINTDHPDFLKGMTVWDLMSAAQYVEKNDPTAVTSLKTHVENKKNTSSTNELSLMEGWMELKEMPSGGVKLSFKSAYTRKWCVLAKRSLVVSDTEEGENATAIELDGAKCTLAPGQSDCKLEVTVASNGPRYTFKASDHGNATKWCHSIEIASNQESWDAFVAGKLKQPKANPMFQQSFKAKTPATNRPGRTPSMTNSDVIQTRVVETLLTEYFEIVRKKILDSIPKAITLKLVSNVSKSLHTELVQALYDPAKVNELLSETAETEAKRERLSSVLKMMEEARLAVQQVMIG